MKRLLILALAGALAGCSTVGTGFRGVVLNFNHPTGEIKSEGLFFYNPLSTSIVEMNVQTVADHVEASASTSDLQTVNSKVTVNYHLDPAAVVTVYDKLRNDYESRIINPTVQESIKASTARFHASELIAHRKKLYEKYAHRVVSIERLRKTNPDARAFLEYVDAQARPA